MTIKLAILRTGEEIISDVKEGMIEDRVVTYIFDNPCKVSLQGSYKIFADDEEPVDRMSISLSRWPTLSADRVVAVVTDFVVTIVEPNCELKQMYENRVLNYGAKNSKIDSTDESTDSNQSD
jgi:hypothetical protein